MSFDPTFLIIGVVALLAVVVVGARWLRQAVTQSDARRRAAFNASIGPERETWAQASGWQFAPGPGRVPLDGLEPAGTREPVVITLALWGTWSGAGDARSAALATRSGEYFSTSTSSWTDWAQQRAEVATLRPVPAMVAIANGEFHAGPLPGVARDNPAMGVIRRPIGRPWLLAAPLGLEGVVTTALVPVLERNTPTGVILHCDGERVIVSSEGSGSRQEMEELLALAGTVATALESIAA